MIKIIAIDGPAASGKGTLSRNLAQSLNFAHMDTGALYRAVAYEALSASLSPKDEKHALIACDKLQEKLSSSTPLENPDLRSEKVGSAASEIAIIQSVRNRLTDIQRSFANNPPNGFVGAILDGRDIGTIICPNAPLKLYITANSKIRAKRRMKELQLKGKSVTYDAVLEDMRARDARDSSRKAAPLKPASDAIIIDSSNLSEHQIMETALIYAKKAFD